MRLLFVVQRFGDDVAGGAERATLEYAVRLAARGHEVEVATSRALGYVDWADHYPFGREQYQGVTVHRFPVSAPRSDARFAPLNLRVPWYPYGTPRVLERQWLHAQGPHLPHLAPWLREHGPHFDVVVGCTYLYEPTWVTIATLAGVVPTALFPFAHDEPPLRLGIFEELLGLPDAYGFLTEEEAALVRRRARRTTPGTVTGVGVDLDVDVSAAEVAGFRAAHGLGDRPYLLFLGRVDPAKGSLELADNFAAYKERQPSDLALVFLGDPVGGRFDRPDMFFTGWVDEAAKHAAIEGSLALVHPSYFESFSIVLCEAWAQRRPAVVNAHCEVLAGQARRSGGALPYRGFAQFEAALDMLVESPALAAALGADGRAYVEQRYRWDDVVDRVELVLDDARRAFAASVRSAS
ncbi:MAG: glycosyltransferase [Acidimicrobiia bacterium]